MARRKLNVGPHLRRVKAHHKRHKKRLLGLFHKIRQHPGCYKAGYGPKRGARVPKTQPRMPRGLNKKGAGLWGKVKSGFSWLAAKGKKVAKDIGSEVVKHAKAQGSAMLEEGKKQAYAYGRRQVARGQSWAKGQVDAAAGRVRTRVNRHLSEASNKIEALARHVDSGVSRYTGAGKQGSGWIGDKLRSGFTSMVRGAGRAIWRRGTRRR